MSRVMFFIDGFNLYHAIQDHAEKYDSTYVKYKWLNFRKLASCYIKKSDEVVNIYYFTAFTYWNVEKVRRHKIYVKALKSENVISIEGEFKRITRFCPLCNREYQTHEEKQTDVNFALNLFKMALDDNYDTAIIISGDSDLIPSIKTVKIKFPNKKIGVVVPIGRRAKAMMKACDFHIKMKKVHLETSLFPPVIKLNNGTILSCPSSWQVN